MSNEPTPEAGVGSLLVYKPGLGVRLTGCAGKGSKDSAARNQG
jgi:hypothetical protein